MLPPDCSDNEVDVECEAEVRFPFANARGVYDRERGPRHSPKEGVGHRRMPVHARVCGTRSELAGPRDGGGDLISCRVKI
jgi:hypothetical protein